MIEKVSGVYTVHKGTTIEKKIETLSYHITPRIGGKVVYEGLLLK